MRQFCHFLKNLFLDFLYPPFCCGCDQLGSYLCARCFSQTHFFAQAVSLKLEPNYLDQLLSACHYQFPIDRLIKEMKYQGVIELARLGGQLLYQTVDLPRIDLITAVPLHSKRLNERGFNQAEVMAQELSFRLKVPYQPLLLRTVNTPHQAAITQRSLRLEQLQSCFSLNPVCNEQLPGKSILLIDDVTTTGTTLNECARVLKDHSVSRVIGFTLAHGS